MSFISSVTNASPRLASFGDRVHYGDISADESEPWENGVAAVSKEQIRQSMDQLLQTWQIDHFEEEKKKLAELQTLEQKEDPTSPLRELNKRIFMHMKQNHGVDTPMEFLWALQGHKLWNPIPIMTRPENFIPKEDRFYRFELFGELEAINDESSKSFGYAFKRIGNQLHLYLDSQTEEDYLLINGKKYSFAGSNRGGYQKPSYQLREGDVVCSVGMFSSFFIVGKNGEVLLPARERQGYENEIDQTKQINSQKISPNDNELLYTTHKKFISEIIEPFKPGFTHYPQAFPICVRPEK